MHSKLIPVCFVVLFACLLTVLFVLLLHRKHDDHEDDHKLPEDSKRARFLNNLVNYSDIPTALTCPRCSKKELIDYLCDAGFVLIVNITDTGTKYSTNNLTSFVIERNNTLKSQPFLGVSLSRRLIYTNAASINKIDDRSDTCNLKLQKNNFYLITGRVEDGNALFTECDLVINWSGMTIEVQEKYLSLFQPSLICKNT